MAGAITITFEQEGEAPVSFTIPASFADLIQSHVDAQTYSEQYVDEGGVTRVRRVNPYGGSKATFFKKACQERILGPILRQYASLIPAVKAVDDQIAALQAQRAAAITQEVLIPQTP